MTGYVSLHNHTHGSLLDGFARSSDYFERASELKMPGLGLTDHGNVTQLYEFLKLAKKYDMIGVPGCEMYVAPINPEGARVQEPVFYGDGSNKFDVSSRGAYLHLSVWAYNHEGLKNLFKLSTMSHDPKNTYRKPRIDFDMLEQYSNGLVVSTGCPSSEISTRFLLGQDEKAYEYCSRLKEVFGDRLYVEIMNHSMSIDLERMLIPKQLELSRRMGVGLLATNDCHYTLQKEARHHEELLCVQSAAKMTDSTYDEGGKRFAFNGSEFYLKSFEEMLELFPDDEFPNALKNTLEVTERAQGLELLPDSGLKPRFEPPNGLSEIDYFHRLINEGFARRYGNHPKEFKQIAKERVRQEDQVIVSSDFVGYFLVVHDYINYTRDRHSLRDEEGSILALPVGPGRGSVGGSVIAYLLGITEICPIRHGLIFERFMTEGRGATYQIEYDDGSIEVSNVSGSRKVKSEGGTNRYIYQLNVGDEIETSEND